MRRVPYVQVMWQQPSRRPRNGLGGRHGLREGGFPSVSVPRADPAAVNGFWPRSAEWRSALARRQQPGGVPAFSPHPSAVNSLHPSPLPEPLLPENSFAQSWTQHSLRRLSSSRIAAALPLIRVPMARLFFSAAALPCSLDSAQPSFVGPLLFPPPLLSFFLSLFFCVRRFLQKRFWNLPHPIRAHFYPFMFTTFLSSFSTVVHLIALCFFPYVVLCSNYCALCIGYD
ncbi:hypothetical protein HPB48_024577 [Haemaphysalis longicornis]|uniref:Transmembrane protein n=1 Tax=Haemaphysalis longicornis TaxID=44386 RepID=A0A9J6H6I5_HAELO|nr:hypothetical protein HPB48_024577 [Haemaphysalis longicornis]